MRHRACFSLPFTASLPVSSVLRPTRVKSSPLFSKSQPFSATLLNTRTFSSSSKQSLRYRPPPPKSNRPFSFLDSIPLNVIFYGIIGTNVFVFGMWKLAEQKYRRNRDSSSVKWMYQNFTNSLRNMSEGRFWTILTSSFSHQDNMHILFNMFTFYFMARPVLNGLLPRQFLFLYLGGGLVCSAASLTYSWLMNRDRSSLGASGAVYSVTAFLACIAPKMTFQFYGIIPVPAWLAVSGIFAYDAYNTITSNQGTTDTVGHIGGMLAGVCYFLAGRFRIF